MKRLTIALIFLFVLSTIHCVKGQVGYYPFKEIQVGTRRVELREIKQVFLEKKNFVKLGEGILKRKKSKESHYPMTPRKRRQILRKALKDKTTDKTKLLIIYVDDDQYYNSNNKQLYYCWGYEN